MRYFNVIIHITHFKNHSDAIIIFFLSMSNFNISLYEMYKKHNLRMTNINWIYFFFYLINDYSRRVKFMNVTYTFSNKTQTNTSKQHKYYSGKF